MGLVFSILQTIVICALCFVLWYLAKSVFLRSPLDNVPGPVSQSFLKGNFGQLLDRTGWDFQWEIGEKYGSVVKLNGLLGSKHLFVFDPLALSSVIVKDQYVYEETPDFLGSMHLMLGDGLLATLGERHRKQRRMLNPVFSIAHMRHMVPIFYRITNKLRDAIAVRVKEGVQEIDILDWMGRTALELVGQAGLGYSFDPLTSDASDDFGKAIKSIVPTLFPLRIVRPLLPLAMKFGPPSFRRRLVQMSPNPHIRRAGEISDAIAEHSHRIYEEKKAALERGDEDVTHQIGEGKDIMSKLMQANMAASEEDRLPEDELLGQMSTFIFAGMDTTSNALARTLDLLAKHPEVQEKLRAEIQEARRNNEEIPYDQLVELPYLDAVCRETLRVCAPVPFLVRNTGKDMVMPLSTPIRGNDGTMMNEIPVPKGTGILIGILACNRNAEIWGPDAAEWKPERWLKPLPEAVTNAHVPGVYSHLMTFLGGGRACIGFKFSQLEMKVVLAVLLSSFTFESAGKEIFWNVAGIQYPTIGLNPKPEMPMKIGFAKGL
ncbi:cytochrome P450 [Laetiporus sulphureus 93-53]|uniref:Cytochrome P450 n=1 Tax=Laetiporus sulphureus 93-53 TaxID=1314785 RepID=A0A165D2P1_9APHY|nr:cytochrome P450 [Laetiporus sulphureus 93-53]KZT04037.1 cytochrome P450 [Laetiporus sulphureus 93-53]